MVFPSCLFLGLLLNVYYLTNLRKEIFSMVSWDESFPDFDLKQTDTASSKDLKNIKCFTNGSKIQKFSEI